MIKSFENHSPQIAPDVFIADSALVLGQVALAKDSNIWYGSVLRGDINAIEIGEGSNIQDLCVVHVAHDTYATKVGSMVTVGHGAVLHGCTIRSNTLVGMGAILLDGVEVGEGSVIAAGALLPPGKKYPGGSLIVGSPAQVKRPVTPEETAWIQSSATYYVALAKRHATLR